MSKTDARTGIVAAKPLKVTDADFVFKVLRSKEPVLIDFYADWCGACVAVAPVLDKIAADQAGVVRVAKIDVEKDGATAQRYGVRSIPTLILFVDGEEKARLVNVVRERPILDALAEHLEIRS